MIQSTIIKSSIIVILVAILCGLIYAIVESKKNTFTFLDYQARCNHAGGVVVFTLPDYTCYENQIIIER